MHNSITRENLHILMKSFYMKAIEDDVLGPFFIHELGDDIEDEEWIEHIDLLADFWLAELLEYDTYYGNFIGAHVKMPHIHKETFSVWIKLFSIAADEVYTPELSTRFKKHGLLLSKKFINNLGPQTLKSSKIFTLKGK